MPVDIAMQIAASGLTIYDPLEAHPDLFIATQDLENILNAKLVGLDLNYESRTRSKVLKTAVCRALGYPVPQRFKRTKPRFLGQDFDTYGQKANNLQIWNEEISPSRRYVVVRIDTKGKFSRVRVIGGEELAKYDTTGKLTQKYQARMKVALSESLLVSTEDTSNIKARILNNPETSFRDFMAIREVYNRLLQLVGETIVDPGKSQDRNRGAALHHAISDCLELPKYQDSGQFPDIYEQLVELKMQTAQTVDLGLVCPDSTGHLSSDLEIRHCDVRYAVFYGTIVDGKVHLDHFVLTTGEKFFDVFQRFEGKVTNKKLQLHLPTDFFGETKATAD